MKLISTNLFIVILNTLWVACRGAPLMDIKNILDREILQPVLPSACSPNGGCWGWLPVQEVQENDAIVPDRIAISRLHTRRQIPSTGTSPGLEAWSENRSLLNKRIPVPLESTGQLGSRITKKDVLLSRTWGAGGMPFSVLYMSPHGPRPNHAGTTQQLDAGKATESSTPPISQPNYRIALRNGANSPPRRQYSIIPQLFISYGWGPLGK